MITIEFKKKSGIYKISSKLDSRFYIGSASCLYTRYHCHKLALVRGCHNNRYLQNFVDKYGFENLVFEVIEFCEKPTLLEREQFYLDTLQPGFNIVKNVENSLGYRHTPESKKKMSAAWKTRTVNGMRGRKHQKETKIKISEKAKERGLHPNFKAGSIKANTGRKHTKEHRHSIAIKQSKVDIEQIRQIHWLRRFRFYQKDIARMFDISQRLVCRIENRLGIYRHFYETDIDYFNDGEKRFAEHIKQPNLFIPEKQPVIQEALF